MTTILPMTTPRCRCCDQPSTLIRRSDLGAGMLVCVASGQSYQIEGQQLVPVTRQPRGRTQDSVRVDLSRASYS